MHCTECGIKLSDEGKFCKGCGTSITSADATREEIGSAVSSAPPPVVRNKKWWYIGAAVLLLYFYGSKVTDRERATTTAINSSQQPATATAHASKQPDPIQVAQRASPKGPLEKMQVMLEHLASHPNMLCRNGIEGPYGTRVMFGNLLRSVGNQDQALASQYWPPVKERFQAAEAMGCFEGLSN